VRPARRGWASARPVASDPADSSDTVPCRADPELFFPVGTAAPAMQQTERAKRVCAGCPRRMRCLDAAMSDLTMEGVWAATTPEERRHAAKAGPAAVRSLYATVEAMRPRWTPAQRRTPRTDGRPDTSVRTRARQAVLASDWQVSA
jgi:WhiB family redox-sensing transcriptional regulator